MTRLLACAPLCVAVAAALSGCGLPASGGQAGSARSYVLPLEPVIGGLPGEGKHIVLVAGDEEYRSEEALPMLARVLALRHGFRCTVLFSIDAESGTIDPGARGHIPGLSALDDADLLVLFTRFRRLPDADMKHIVDYVESGRPLIGIRTATHAFDYEPGSTSAYAHWSWNSEAWPGGFGRQVLGETWVAHYGRHGEESTRGVVPRAVARHPVVRGVGEVWGPTDVYTVRALPADAVVVLEGEVLSGMDRRDPPVTDGRNAPRMPIAWLRERPLPGDRSQRIVCSTIGAAVDFEDGGLRRLFLNACYWALGLEEDLPEQVDVGPVGAYRPSMFGFGKHRVGVRPGDFEVSSRGR